MLNTVFQLSAPKKFEITFQDIDFTDTEVVVRPTYLSICNADQRYYQGLRQKEVLMKKLPMALIHEGIGEIVYDRTSTYMIGQNVIMIPNVPSEIDTIIGENYIRSSKFRSSSMDGFLQEYVKTNVDRIVALPDDISREVAAFTEFVSVSVHAITRFQNISHDRKDVIGVWGDGNLGYITSLFLKKMYPSSKIIVFGVNEYKLADFTFADETYVTTEIPEKLKINHAFECVGGNPSHDAINQIIDLIEPEGTIALLGVSEYLAPLNTRMILEKGLRLYGSSRSGRADFIKTLELYEKYPDIKEYLLNIVNTKVKIREMNDIMKAFELDLQKTYGKTVLEWDK